MAETNQPEKGKTTKNLGRPKIKVVGVGGGGSNAVSRMYRDRISEVEYISVNTDAQALAKSQTPIRLRVGDETARGLGVGGDPSKGRKCHEENRDEIREVLQDSDLVFIAAGLGGGTGTGGGPVIASVARELGALTVGVVTKPFAFEGSRRRKQALEGMKVLAEAVDTIIVVPNDRLLEVSAEKLTIEQAFRLADDVLRQGIQSIAELILTPGEINLDFADVKSVMSNAGQAWMAIGHGSGTDRAVKAAQNAIESPLLEVSVEGAKGVIFNVTGGSDLTLEEVKDTAEFISQIVSPTAHIFFGTTTDLKMEDEIRLTVIATGFPLGDSDLTQTEQPSLSKDAGDSLLKDDKDLDLPPFIRNRLNRNKSQESKEPEAESDADAEETEK